MVLRSLPPPRYEASIMIGHGYGCDGLANQNTVVCAKTTPTMKKNTIQAPTIVRLCEVKGPLFKTEELLFS